MARVAPPCLLGAFCIALRATQQLRRCFIPPSRRKSEIGDELDPNMIDRKLPLESRPPVCELLVHDRGFPPGTP